MYWNLTDDRVPLRAGARIAMAGGPDYVIDSFAGSGGFALTYIAHIPESEQYVALKELFPRRMPNALVRREPDGRITIRDPLAPVACDETAYWEELLRYFAREAALTKRAAALIDQDGGRVRQNNPDVLPVRGPLRAVNGNYYLVLDTYHGLSLRDYINAGWQEPADRGRWINAHTTGVLDLLLKVTLQLSRLHKDNHLLHLDLSPANIYVTRRNAGTDWQPYIIDYGSAYDLDDPAEAADHRFTQNPFSAPEIRALAELNDQDCGYYADASSDTYAVCGMLLYTLTGLEPTEVWQKRQWAPRVRRLFPAEVYLCSDGRPLAERLVKALSKGLAANQRRRFQTAEELYRELRAIQAEMRQVGVLCQMERTELLASLALERYSLYDYAAPGEPLQVLCLGTGEMVRRFLHSVLWCGQMLGRKLHIHIAAPHTAAYKAALLEQCPALRNFSNLCGTAVAGCEYATFFFTDLEALDGDTDVSPLFAAAPSVRYVVVSQGSNAANTALAQKAAQELEPRAGEGKCVVLYYAQEDAAHSIPGAAGRDFACVEQVPLGQWSPADQKASETLGRRAFRVHYLYEKLSDPRANRCASLRAFVQSAYNQRSSAATALHIPYKLYSVGIDPKAPVSEIVAAYRVALQCHRDRLMELEHRRWMMYMTVDGYDFPGKVTRTGNFVADLHQIDGYSFRESAAGFVGKFHSAAQKLHPCLVPFGDGKAALSRDKAFWDSFSSPQEIQAFDGSPLDRVSLSLHFLAACRLQNPAFRRQIESIVRDTIGEKLRTTRKKHPAVDCAFERFLCWCLAIPDRREIRDYLPEKELLLQALARAACEIDLRREWEALENALAVVNEFAAYKDYKAPDAAIVDHLTWICCAPRELTLLKLKAGDVVSNIAVPLSMEPQNVIYYGMETDNRLVRFFQLHGRNTALAFVQPAADDRTEMTRSFLKFCQRLGAPLVIDVTGAEEAACTAAVKAAELEKAIRVVRFDAESGRLQNIANFPQVALYTLPLALSVEEAYTLYGAAEVSPNTSYLYALKDYLPALWRFYTKYRDNWQMVADFFASCGRPQPELICRDLVLDDATKWTSYRAEFAGDQFEQTGFDKIFPALEEAGLVRELGVRAARRSTIVSFVCPDALQAPFTDLLQDLSAVSYSCKIKTLPHKRFSLQIGSNMQVNLKKSAYYGPPGKKHAMKEIKPALRDLREYGLICDTSLGRGGQTLDQISFMFASEAVRDVLASAGNILEAYVWEQADETGYFDDVRPNFFFRWPEKGVSNELDVVATKGLSMLVISCKTSPGDKNHLYEVKCLADRFSVNSKAVLVYASDLDAQGTKSPKGSLTLRRRAAAMGIYLIDRAALDAGTLGPLLEKIAKGELSPEDLLRDAAHRQR